MAQSQQQHKMMPAVWMHVVGTSGPQPPVTSFYNNQPLDSDIGLMATAVAAAAFVTLQ